MVMETGATTGIFPSDEQTRALARRAGPGGATSSSSPPTPARDYDEDGDDRPRRARAADRAAVLAGERRARARGGGDARRGRSASAARSTRRYEDLAIVAAVLRGRSLPARARPDRHARVAADPRHDRAQRRLRRPARRRGAHPRAGLRPVHRHGPGAGRRRRLGADVQPELPRPQRDGRTTASTSARPRPRRRRRCAARSPTRASSASRRR